MNKNELSRVVEVLEREKISDETVRMLKEILKNPFSTNVDLINRPDYVATVLWSKEDFVSSLEERGVEASEENLDYLIETVRPNLEDLSLACEVIEEAVEEMKEKEWLI